MLRSGHTKEAFTPSGQWESSSEHDEAAVLAVYDLGRAVGARSSCIVCRLRHDRRDYLLPSQLVDSGKGRVLFEAGRST